MYYNRPACYFIDSETVCDKAHPCPAFACHQYGKVSRMIAVRLVCWVPVSSAAFEGLFRISDFTYASFMQVESKRPHRAFITGGRSVFRQSSYISTNHGAGRGVGKCYKAGYRRVVGTGNEYRVRSVVPFGARCIRTPGKHRVWTVFPWR